jgi:hypothetical protein
MFLVTCQTLYMIKPSNTTTRSFLDSLIILMETPNHRAHHAAMHLVAAEVVKSNPLPSPAACDAEMLDMPMYPTQGLTLGSKYPR